MSGRNTYLNIISKALLAFLSGWIFNKEFALQDFLTNIFDRGIILFLTVSKNKIAATPENIGVVAILTVVLNYSILFPSFTFFLDGFHLAFGDKFEICIKTTDLM